MTKRVLIVGAGPAGAAAALVLARARVCEVWLLDRASFPRDKICAGGLSRKAQGVLARLGLLDPVMRQGHTTTRLQLVGPGGEHFMLGRSRSLLLPRRLFDPILVRAACREGALLREGVRARALAFEAGRLAGLETNQGALEADLVLVAAGGQAHDLLPPAPPPALNLALQQRCEGLQLRPDTAEMVFSEALLPGYGWVFPESRTRATVGVCVGALAHRRHMHALLQRFIDDVLGPRMRGARLLGPAQGQPIAWRASVPRLHDRAVLWAGEAAGLSSALTGEGIWQALASGASAGRAMALALGRGRPSLLELHRLECAAELGPALAASAAFRRLLPAAPARFALRFARSGAGHHLATRVLERL